MFHVLEQYLSSLVFLVNNISKVEALFKSMAFPSNDEDNNHVHLIYEGGEIVRLRKTGNSILQPLV